MAGSRGLLNWLIVLCSMSGGSVVLMVAFSQKGLMCLSFLQTDELDYFSG